MSSPYDPEVVVIGYDCPPTLEFELQHLTEEIRRGPAARGGLRLRAWPPMPPAPDECNTLSSAAGRRPLTAAGQLRPVSYQQQPHFGNLVVPPLEMGPDEFHPNPVPPAHLAPVPTPIGGPPPIGEPPPATEVRVVVHDFRPYRPMQLDVTISVIDVQSGQELTAIQGLWHGKEEAEPIADASPVLRRALKHPPPRADLEARTLSGLSPRLFLSGVAKEVVPALHGACLTTAGGW